MATHANRVQMTVSGTPGTGTITLGSASSGYRSFASAYGADATVDVLIVDGTAWEVARGCAYTNSGTTLSRGTLESSSTGSAISLTSAAIVSVIATADSGRRWDAAALEHSTVTGTSGAITAAVNTLYVADMSGWTADRTLTLPATAAVGDRVGMMVSTGDDAYEWIVQANTGDTLNGVTAAEWSRLFITGETIIMRCVVANSTWIVEYDGRIPQQCGCRLTTSTANTETAATVTTPTDKSGVWTAYTDNASLAVTASSDIKTRRAGNFLVGVQGVSSLDVESGKYFSVYLYKNGTTDILVGVQFVQGALVLGRVGAQTAMVALATDDYIKYRYRSEEGSKGLLASTSPAHNTVFHLTEVF